MALFGKSTGEDLTGGLQSFLSTTLKHLRSFIELDETFTRGLVDLSESVKSVDEAQTLEVLRKEYRSIIGRIDEELQKSKQAGGKGRIGPGIEILDAPTGKEAMERTALYEEWIEVHKLLLTAFSKGASLLLEKDDPLEKDLDPLKKKEIRRLPLSEGERLQTSILEAFFRKSNEISICAQERQDLKEIISALTQNIQSLSLMNQGYHDKLGTYARAITEATELPEIQKIKDKILEETRQIQMENLRVKEKLIQSKVEIEEANNRIVQLETELKKVREQSNLDDLTKVFNRETFDRKLQERILYLRHNKETSTLIFFDLDHFKGFNEKYGPRAGDVVLKTVVALVREVIKSKDVIARYDGAKFALILPKTKAKEGAAVAETIRVNVADHEFIYKGNPISVTLSLGVRTLQPDDDPKTAVQKTTALLVEAKEGGRNRIAVET